MARSLAAAAAALALLASGVTAQCDEEYECEYRSPDIFNAFYDLRPLCTQGIPYVYEDTSNNTYMFMVCGNAPVECIPPYAVEYQRGVAVQFFGDQPPANQTCLNKAGVQVSCTRDCEVLGTGPPIITLRDPTNSFGGVNVTHYGVPSLPTDPFQCPFDPSTGATEERQVTLSIKCNSQAFLKPLVTWAGEVAPCRYVILMESSHACGCIPNCYNRNCGPNGCGGYCGGLGQGGSCPNDGVTTCTSGGVCCTPDCRGRQCGDDGCGGSCGTCNSPAICNKYQLCYNPNNQASPMPSARPAATITTTTGADKFAAFVGGSITVGVVGAVILYVMRLRAGV